MLGDTENARSRVTRRAFLTAGAVLGGIAVESSAAPSAEASELPSAAVLAAAVDSSIVDSIAVVAENSRFAGIDPTGATDSRDGLQRAVNATPDGGTLVIPPGTYLLGSVIAPQGGRSITISAYGATLVQTSDSGIVALAGSYSTPVNVSAIGTTTVTTDYSSASVSTITTSTSQSWVEGDVIKIVSEDVIPETKMGTATTSAKFGEFAVVHSVSGTVITLTGKLRESYTTGMRVARISKQTFALLGATLQVSDGELSSTNSLAMISLSKLFRPRIIDVKVTRASNMVFQMASCLGYLVENVDISAAKDNQNSNRFGYGVIDNSSNFGVVRGGTFRHVRHAYTDDTALVAAWGDFAKYGRTYGTKVIGVHAMSTTSSSFDTHHGSEGTEFIACTATTGFAQSAQAGFQLRGINHRVIECSVMGTTYGVSVVNGSTGGDSRGHFVTGLRVKEVLDSAVAAYVRGTGHPQAGIRDPSMSLTIDGINVTDTPRLLASENASVSIANAVFVAPSGVAGQNIEGMFSNNSFVRFTNSVMDFQGTSAGIARPLISDTDPTRNPGRQDTDVSQLEVRLTADVATRAYYPIGGDYHRVHARGLRYTYPFRSLPGQTMAQSTLDWSCDFDPAVPRSMLNSGYFQFDGAAALTVELTEVAKSIDRRITVAVNPGNGTAVLSGPLPIGQLTGQVLSIIQYGGNGTYTLRNGSAYRTNLAGGVDRKLTQGRRIDVYWDGSAWHEYPLIA